MGKHDGVEWGCTRTRLQLGQEWKRRVRLHLALELLLEGRDQLFRHRLPPFAAPSSDAQRCCVGASDMGSGDHADAGGGAGGEELTAVQRQAGLRHGLILSFRKHHASFPEELSPTVPARPDTTSTATKDQTTTAAPI